MTYDALGAHGTIITEDRKTKEVRYTSNGRWWEKGTHKYIKPCRGDHEHRQAGVLFMEDGGMIRIWMCKCGAWFELDCQRSGDKQVWKSFYYAE